MLMAACFELSVMMTKRVMGKTKAPEEVIPHHSGTL